MAARPKHIELSDRAVPSGKIRDTSLDSESSSGSRESGSSTSEESRLRKLFESCDADGDGLLDRDDFAYMCRQLNLEEWTTDILQQLGVDQSSEISFADFIRCRTQVLENEEQQSPVSPHSRTYLDDKDTGIDLDMSRQHNNNNVTSWPTMSSDSLGALSGRHPESIDYDSGARDLQSPEPLVTLHRMLENHDAQLLQRVQESCPESAEFLTLANRLHQAAITSVKGEIIDLRSRLQRESLEKDSLEKQMTKLHCEGQALQDDYDERLDEITFRYEERITELHSVIAELRKKIERHQINVIKEEDEEEEVDPAVSMKSQDGRSDNDNTVGSNALPTDGDLNLELSRVVTELESAIHERRKNKDQVDGASEDVQDDGVEEKALEVCKNLDDFSFDPELGPKGLRPAMFHPPPPPPPNEFPDPGYLQEEITSLRTENTTLQEQMVKQESELDKCRQMITTLTDGQQKGMITALTDGQQKGMITALTDGQQKGKKQPSEPPSSRLPGYEGPASGHNSRTSTPTKSQNLSSGRVESATASPMKASDQFPVAKVAELKKLKTVSSDRERHILGSELSSMPNTKVAEHLVQGIWKESNIQEIMQTANHGSMSDAKVTEFEIELERLNSQIDNLKSQQDVSNLTLGESKAQCDRLTVLIGKYESNNTALQIVLNYSDQCIETYEVLCALLESEMGVVLANCRAAGLGGLDQSFSDDPAEINSILQRAHNCRQASENVANHYLHKLDRSYGAVTGRASPPRPWEDLSCTSKTASSSSSAGDTEFTKADERRVRDYIHQLKKGRNSVQLTVMELESVHTDPNSDKVWKTPDAQRLDLENAVIMQELMAIKEEKSEVKAQNYLLEKEKRALELRLGGKQSQEAAYLVQIEHLKAELSDLGQGSREVTEQGQGSSSDGSLGDKDDTDTTSAISSETKSRGHTRLSHDLNAALKRERKLKSQVADLVSALDKLSRNSEIRHQQSAEFVNDLKRANSALISAFDKAKKKYQGKLKKLEGQMQSLTERYETQIHMMKQRISRMEDEKARVSNETSL